VVLWAREPELVRDLNQKRENTLYLKGIILESGMRITGDLEALAACDVLLSTVPAQHTRATLSGLKSGLKTGTPVVLCAKGIEHGTGRFMADVLRETLPGAEAAILSGPSFAGDVARGLPTAVTLAAEDLALAETLAAAIGLPTFRPYVSTDVVGAEIGGAVKNVLAIACGIAEGKALGPSARAALITRGFAELVRFGVAFGARPETMSGLSGLGDLVLTCSSPNSRNFAFGLALGRGAPVEAALKASQGVVEGAATAQALLDLAQERGIEMPISEAVNGILQGRLRVESAIQALLTRPFRAESTR
jgi:glycerol-3-phosphate dehydrogenase (NAD(P)+)